MDRVSLLDDIRNAAKQHGCDDGDLTHDVFGENLCDGLCYGYLGLSRN
jgi:hypothetical protein